MFRPHLDLKLQHPAAAAVPPIGDDLVFEIKLDGWRLAVSTAGGRARLKTRGGHELAVPHVADALTGLGRAAVLDGELAVAGDDGVTHLSRLERALGDTRRLGAISRLPAAPAGGSPIFYGVFDLLMLDGVDLRPRPWLERKAALRTLLGDMPGPLVYVEHFECAGEALFEQARLRGLEGIVAKRRKAPYRGGRSTAWVKTKVRAAMQLPIVGWRGADRVEGLLVAERDERGRLRVAGEVEFGLQVLRGRRALPALRSLERAGATAASAPSDDVHWVEPRLIAHVDHVGRTGNGYLRELVLRDVTVDGSADTLSTDEES